ncbi:alpha-amylase family protein [Devosia sp. XJ19-1]|uniref:Alpha-amylase family protein n=1 Tax=Devosia ureilytica TaxID=2952754 RepID=A0A9Q4AN67_9HYPH|nr:alpha-amylase family protein [Devosia ureilytica]MCP8883676.1 alpha-amylase family protein [Devosia ureilytica]MCP8887284.1 alpha-amylase family protein [Devosia ureilytica]
MSDLWYKNAIIYCLDVEKFMDADGDGVGDFRGLADRLDYLERLGVNCLWLNPFFPTPNRDNGYDITDYYGVDPRHGTLGDFVEFMHAAKDRGMRVIIDLVVNHTSIEHPWFQSARSSPDSPFRDWYIWSDEKPADATDGIVFPGVQKSVWTYDRKAGAWYMHRFYPHQADLNGANPDVQDEILKIMGFWLALGVSGFRVDAVPFLVQTKTGKAGEDFSLLTRMHDFLAWRRAGAVLLAEAAISYDRTEDYYDQGDRMSMVFDFLLNQHLILSFARKTAAPLRQVLERRPLPGGTGQWANFIRSHDELSLERLSEQEQQECFDAFGPKPEHQIYGRGLRRRLAGMFDGDQTRLSLAYSLLFALPGTPVLWFGEEIGLGENLNLPEREAVRTPMQWADERNGGFSPSKEPREDLPKPNGKFGYHAVNVAEQIRNRDSLLQAVSAMIRTRRSAPEIGWGETSLIDTGDDEVLVLVSQWRGGRVVTLHNFSPKPKSIKLEIDAIERYLPMLSTEGTLAPFPAEQPVDIPPYGYCWLRCDQERR